MFTELPGSFLAFSESFQLHINCFVSSFERHLFSSCLFYPFYYVNFLFSKKIYLFPKQGLFSWSILGLGHILFVSRTDLFCIYYPLLVFSPHIVVPSHEVTTVASAPPSHQSIAIGIEVLTDLESMSSLTQNRYGVHHVLAGK